MAVTEKFLREQAELDLAQAERHAGDYERLRRNRQGLQWAVSRPTPFRCRAESAPLPRWEATLHVSCDACTFRGSHTMVERTWDAVVVATYHLTFAHGVHV